jgi:hypothetical protein
VGRILGVRDKESGGSDYWLSVTYGNAVLYLGMWWISCNGKLARMIGDAVSKHCWFSCGGGKEKILWILRRAED